MGELTAGQVLAQVDSLLPNAYTREEKLRAAYPESRRLMFGLCAAAGSFLILLLL